MLVWLVIVDGCGLEERWLDWMIALGRLGKVDSIIKWITWIVCI